MCVRSEIRRSRGRPRKPASRYTAAAAWDSVTLTTPREWLQQYAQGLKTQHLPCSIKNISYMILPEMEQLVGNRSNFIDPYTFSNDWFFWLLVWPIVNKDLSERSNDPAIFYIFFLSRSFFRIIATLCNRVEFEENRASPRPVPGPSVPSISAGRHDESRIKRML